jgi:PAS domain S-box-containing protein
MSAEGTTQGSTDPSAALACAIPISRPSDWLDALPVGVVAWADSGEIIYVNSFVADLMGSRGADLVGRSVPEESWWPIEAVDEDGHRIDFARFDQLVLQEGGGHCVTIGIRPRDESGRVRWFEVSRTPIRGGRLSTFVEVEAGRRQATSLWARANRLRMHLDNVGDAYIVVDDEARIVECFGPGGQELGGRGSTTTLYDIVPQASEANVRQGFADLHAGQPSSRFSIVWDGEGEESVAGVHCRRLPDGLIGCLVYDITERWLAEEELLGQRERYRMLAENCPDVITWVSVRSGIQVEYVSPSIRQLLGCEPEDFYRDPGMADRILPRPLSGIASAASDLFEAGVHILDLPLRHRDGHEVWVEANSRVFRGADGRVTGIETVLREVSARRLAEAEREHAET